MAQTPFGNLFDAEPQYGEVQLQAQLAKEAPVSGAPLAGLSSPGGQVTKGPLPPPIPPLPAGPVTSTPAHGVDGQPYQDKVAATWRAIAKLPGASGEVKQVARVALQRAKQHAAIQTGQAA